MIRPSLLWVAASVALGVTVAACSDGPKSPAVPTAGSQPTTTAAPAGGPGLSGQTPLAQAEAYSQCMRSHGAPNFPDPVLTPSGGYGYRTTGIDPHSAAFQGALQACKALPSPWQSTGQQLSPAQQAGVVDLGQVHPRPRGAELPRPDLFGRRSGPDFRRRRGRAPSSCSRRWTPASCSFRPLVALAGDRPGGLRVRVLVVEDCQPLADLVATLSQRRWWSPSAGSGASWENRK